MPVKYVKPALIAPFPWPGGKRRVAHHVWARFGNVRRYIEPFCGSAAVLLARPAEHLSGGSTRVEIINDKDGVIVNFFRAVKYDIEAVAHYADWPVTELDHKARVSEVQLSRDSLSERLAADSSYFDARIAGFFAWAQGCSIAARMGSGVSLARSTGVHSISAEGDRRGVILRLADRLNHTTIACGDWRRVVRPSMMRQNDAAGPIGVFIDPPYGEGNMEYAAGGNRAGVIAREVWEWAQDAWRDDSGGLAPMVCVATHDDGRAIPEGWEVVRWLRRYGVGQRARTSELLLFSPNCKKPGTQDATLFT